uniref:NADH:ubiquinone oxidoreductase complex assembly factor 2 n=1 Tax=Homo sapiens TaxID=9606 RepID=A0A7I2V3X5_HUMAN
MGWSQDLFRALWRSLSREVKEHVGTDQFGNKYYYIPQYKNWRETGSRYFVQAGVEPQASSCPPTLAY